MTMSRTETYNKIEYVVCCVGAFAKQFKLTNAQAYAYLLRLRGNHAVQYFFGTEKAVKLLNKVIL